MSLINDALKRAQSGDPDRVTPPARAAARPWTAPAPLPDRARRRTRRAAAVVVILASAAGAGILLVRSRTIRSRSGPDFPVERPSTVSRLPSPVPVNEPSSASPRGNREPAWAPRTQALSAESKRARRTEATSRATAPASHAGETERPAAPGADWKPSEESNNAAASRTYVGEAPLSDGRKIELGGIVYSNERPVALVNGRVLPAGAVVNGCTIVEIREDRVEFRDADRTFVITLK